jgi:hypothetical protein
LSLGLGSSVSTTARAQESARGRCEGMLQTSLMMVLCGPRVQQPVDLVTHSGGGWLAGWGTTHSKRTTMTTLSLTRELPTTTTRLMTPCSTKRCSVYPCSLPLHDLPCVVATHTLSHSLAFFQNLFKLERPLAITVCPHPSRESGRVSCRRGAMRCSHARIHTDVPSRGAPCPLVL